MASFSNVLHEQDKLHDLYDSLVEARNEVGQEAVPFHKFAEICEEPGEEAQRRRQRRGGVPRGYEGWEGGLTARAMKGAK